MDEDLSRRRLTRVRNGSYIIGGMAFVVSILAATIGVPPGGAWFAFTIGAIVLLFTSLAMFQWTVESAFKDCETELARISPGVHCKYVGNREDGVKYLIKKCHSGSLKTIRDTHFRFDNDSAPYPPELYEDLIAAFRRFLTPSEEAYVSFVVGGITDPRLMKKLAELIKEVGESRIAFYKSRVDAPYLSVLILEYSGTNRMEVLFGWGKHARGKPGYVFRSEHPELVQEFLHYYESLEAGSKRVSLNSVFKGPSALSYSGPERFWSPHLDSGNGSMIVYTEPLCFRVFIDADPPAVPRDIRLFIRDVDINEQADPILEFKKKLPWLNDRRIEKSHAYIPNGEAFGKEHIRDWLRLHGAETADSVVSRKTQWEPGSIGSLENRNLIVLGSVRTNSAVRTLWKKAGYSARFRYMHEPRGIRIMDPSPSERQRIDNYLEPADTGAGRLIGEDWDAESMVLVTRGWNVDRTKVVTLILANQGIGIDAVISKYLVNEHVGDWQELEDRLAEFNFPRDGRLPDAFQMVFRVLLDQEDDQARAIGWEPLLYCACAKS